MHYFQDAPPSCQLYGTDIDMELVSWCEKHLPRIRWSTNGYQPPLPFTDNTFDLIYAISVFTHLDEEFQKAWLRELHRVAKPGATIILTVHGEYCINSLSPSLQNRIRSHGFLFTTGATGNLNSTSCQIFIKLLIIHRNIFIVNGQIISKVVRYIERGINNHQDAVLLRKKLAQTRRPI